MELRSRNVNSRLEFRDRFAGVALVGRFVDQGVGDGVDGQAGITKGTTTRRGGELNTPVCDSVYTAVSI